MHDSSRVQAVRLKRRAGARDAIPDEAFLRVRGALFFGPGFLVTRNKLTFRDNLAELLAAAVPGALVLHVVLPGTSQQGACVCTVLSSQHCMCTARERHGSATSMPAQAQGDGAACRGAQDGGQVPQVAAGKPLLMD